MPQSPALETTLKALADPIRLEIMRRVALDSEVPCTLLEQVLDVGKSTISYHVKVLYQADLLAIRKEGRYYFYSLRSEQLEERIPGFRQLLIVREPYPPR